MQDMIGINAGKLWTLLRHEGGKSPYAIGKTLGLKTPDVDRAIGWLAREGKLQFQTDGRGTTRVSLDGE